MAYRIPLISYDFIVKSNGYGYTLKTLGSTDKLLQFSGPDWRVHTINNETSSYIVEIQRWNLDILQET